MFLVLSVVIFILYIFACYIWVIRFFSVLSMKMENVFIEVVVLKSVMTTCGLRERNDTYLTHKT